MRGQVFINSALVLPNTAYVCIGQTATLGSYYDCFPEGVYLNSMNNFPYGISFEQTSLDKDLEELVETFGYQGYTSSDIDFDGADNQIMVVGSGTEVFYNEQNQEIEKDVNYTKYLFTKDGKVYLPKIYTDLDGTNYDTYKNILETWKFK